MNYRHAYHAGNFADVLKHAVLCLGLTYLKKKEAAFRVLDSHAGIGCYDLAGAEAEKTGEWRHGIGKLIAPEAAALPAQAATLLAPYLDIVRKLNQGGELVHYPGSPLLAQALTRPQDRLVFCELHPADAGALRAGLPRDARMQIHHMDGWQALKAMLPPPERRGLILVDPPYEQRGELDRLVAGFAAAYRRFATGMYMLWYPIKDVASIDAMAGAIKAQGLSKLLRVELLIRAPDDPALLNGCGLLIINPPFTLAADLQAILPLLTDRLAQGRGAGFNLQDM